MLLPGADGFRPLLCFGNFVCILIGWGLDGDSARLSLLLLLLAFGSTSRTFALVLLHDLFGQLFILFDNPSDLALYVLLLLFHLSDQILKLLNLHSHESALLVVSLNLLLRLRSGGRVHLINFSPRSGGLSLLVLLLSSRSVYRKWVLLVFSL